MRTCFVTGAAGFVGSTLVDQLLGTGHKVVGWDNFSTGRREFLGTATNHPHFRLHEGDNLDRSSLTAAMRGCDFVFHMAANADVRFGLKHPEKDLQQNTIATFNVLEAMRANGIGAIAFASTGSVYGEAAVIPTPEDCPFPTQTSLYGASKLAGEALIAAYCEGYGFLGHVFRFVSLLGPRYTHGHVFDFVQKLRQDPHQIAVLGDGHQRKSYLHVSDAILAMQKAMEPTGAQTASTRFKVYNLGRTDSCEVRDSLGWICERLGVTPAVDYAGGRQGWIGDNPCIILDTQRIQALGWQPQYTIREAVYRTVDWLVANSWVFASGAKAGSP